MSMGGFLMTLLELSLQAGAAILLILVIRLVFRKIPARMLCVLWLIVAARLLIPYSFESDIALSRRLSEFVKEERTLHTYVLQHEETVVYVAEEASGASEERIDVLLNAINEAGENAVPGVDTNDEVDYYISESPRSSEDGEITSGYSSRGNVRTTGYGKLFFTLWLVGALLLLSYGIYGYVRVGASMKGAILYRDNIWLCEGTESAFLFGWLKPRIYLPCSMEEEQMDYVIRHEMAHIARKDHYGKLLGYLLLSMYWFQPLVWVAYHLYCKDVERACDEKVISEFDVEHRKGYAEALLLCSLNGNLAMAHPLAFGETDVKHRIEGILTYKKPGRWVVLFSVLLCALMVAGCFTVGKEQEGGSTLSGVNGVLPTPAAETPTPVVVTPTPVLPTPTLTETEDSEETVTLQAIRMGESRMLDLNGDGTEETVSVQIDIADTGIPLLTVTDVTGNCAEAVCNRDDNPDIAVWYLCDIDVKDGYKEIGIAYGGPSGDPITYFYRYVDGACKSIGTVENIPLDTWSGVSEDLQVIENGAFRMEMPGDGNIYAYKRVFLLETSGTLCKWTLQNANSKEARLEEVYQGRYEFLGWNEERGEEYEVCAAREFNAYMSDSMYEEEVAVIPEGSIVTFYEYYLTDFWGRGWVHFYYTVEEKWDSSGWLYINENGIYLPKGSEDAPMEAVSPEELFDNLSYAG